MIDAVCLYALVAGMAAALGSGILMLSAGLTQVFDSALEFSGLGMDHGGDRGTFIVSSATGLMNGIRILSDINTKLLFLLAIIALFSGPTIWILTQSGQSLVDYVVHLLAAKYSVRSRAVGEALE